MEPAGIAVAANIVRGGRRVAKIAILVQLERTAQAIRNGG